MTTLRLPAVQPHRWLRRGQLALVTAALPIASSCNSTVIPPPPPDDPIVVFLLREALHTGVVFPAPTANDPTGYVEFGFGDWSWYALGNDAWYNVFATVLWPTQGALGRREFGVSTPEELRRVAYWAELSPIVVSQQCAQELRQSLQAAFDARLAQAKDRPDLRFRFTPSDDSYWLPHNCADTAAVWAGGGLVVRKVQHAGAGRAVLLHSGEHGGGDVVAVDAAEQVAGLGHPPCLSGPQVVEGGAARAIDAGDPEQIDRTL